MVGLGLQQVAVALQRGLRHATDPFERIGEPLDRHQTPGDARREQRTPERERVGGERPLRPPPRTRATPARPPAGLGGGAAPPPPPPPRPRAPGAPGGGGGGAPPRARP